MALPFVIVIAAGAFAIFLGRNVGRYLAIGVVAAVIVQVYRLRAA